MYSDKYTNNCTENDTEMKRADDVIRHGRLGGERNSDIDSFLSSMEADKNIAPHDVCVDIAHLLMLADCGITSTSNAQKIMRELLRMYYEGVPKSAFDPRYEDIHAGIESTIIANIGIDSGGWLHVARSRNDEVATCLRLYARAAAHIQMQALIDLRQTLINIAQEHIDTIMPGFTHLQHAQPTTLAHHMLAYEQMFARDMERLFSAYTRINKSPLGAAAFASTGYPIDRENTCRDLGFDGIVENTMDAVASRDFACELLSLDAILEMHISRLCEELVIWNSGLVRFVELDDAYCSTSSIMPQKKNPDVAEILRSRTGSVVGEFLSAVSIMKGLPLTYNRDLQDLNSHLFFGTKNVSRDIRLLAGMLKTASFQKDRMREEAGKGYSTATGLADHLVRMYDISFRQAHNLIGSAVRDGNLDLKTVNKAAMELAGINLSEMGLTDAEIEHVLDPEYSVAERNNPGGPAHGAIVDALIHRIRLLEEDKKHYEAIVKQAMEAHKNLIKKAQEFVEG